MTAPEVPEPVRAPVPLATRLGRDATEPDGADGAALAGLGREIEALRRRLDELATVVTRLAQRVTVTKTPATPGPGELVPCWLDHPSEPDADTSIAAHDAEELLTALAVWVGGVYLRYRDATVSFPDCWLWHPEVVEELLWLQHAWQIAYGEGAAPSAVGDWHERHRPGVVSRIRDYAGTCSLEAHVPSQERHTPAPVTPTADAAGVIAGWWATARTEPRASTHRPAVGSRGRGPPRTHGPPPMTATSDPGRRTVWAAGLVVAAGAAVATAHGLFQVAAAANVPTAIAWLYPLITDGLALVAYATTARLHDGGRRYAAGIVVLAAGLSGLAQATYLTGTLTPAGSVTAAPAVLRFGVGAWPAIAAALTAHLLHLISTDTTGRAQDQPASNPLSDAASNPALNAAFNPSNGPFNEPFNPSSNPSSNPVPSNPVERSRSTVERPTAPVQPDPVAELDGQVPLNTADPPPANRERISSGGSARERAHAAAEAHREKHGALPTATDLARLAATSRGTAGTVLKQLRAQRRALHVVNANRENRTQP